MSASVALGKAAAFPAMAFEALRAEPRRPRPTPPDEAVLGRLGGLEVRLARSRAELRAAQALRYRVFYEEGAARASFRQRLSGRDEDRFDPHCDHLLLLDPARGATPQRQVVGTYRLLLPEGAAEAGGFYSAGEYDVASLIARHPGRRFLELGRSCVLPDYRGKRSVELLWHGVWAYVLRHRVDVLFGCASLPGVSAEEIAPMLAFLRAHAKAPDMWRAEPAASRTVIEAGNSPAGDARRTLCALPPLLKGYLRLGGHVSEKAVVDPEFGTTDVLVVLPLENIAPRYVAHYGQAAERFA